MFYSSPRNRKSLKVFISSGPQTEIPFRASWADVGPLGFSRASQAGDMQPRDCSFACIFSRDSALVSSLVIIMRTAAGGIGLHDVSVTSVHIYVIYLWHLWCLWHIFLHFSFLSQGGNPSLCLRRVCFCSQPYFYDTQKITSCKRYRYPSYADRALNGLTCFEVVQYW